MVLSALWPTHCCLCRETLLHKKLDRLPDKLQVPFGVANHDKDCYERMLVGQRQRFKFDSMSNHVNEWRPPSLRKQPKKKEPFYGVHIQFRWFTICIDDLEIQF